MKKIDLKLNKRKDARPCMLGLVSIMGTLPLWSGRSAAFRWWASSCIFPLRKRNGRCETRGTPEVKTVTTSKTEARSVKICRFQTRKRILRRV